MATLHLRAHAAYQRTVLLLIATGAAVAWVGADTDAQVQRVLMVVVGAVIAVAAHQQGIGWWAAAALGAVATLPAAGLWPGLLQICGGTAPGQAAAGTLFGLVSAVGLLAAHVQRRKTQDDLSLRFAAVEWQLDTTAAALCRRALFAHRRVVDECACWATPASRDVAANAAQITEAVLITTVRAYQVRRALRDWVGGAGSAATIARIEDRVQGHVATLERTALALLDRRANAVATAASAIAPLGELLDEAGEQLRRESTALAELDGVTGGDRRTSAG